MKKLLLLVSTTFFMVLVYSQEIQYEITKVGTEYSQSLIEETMQKTDFCGMINPSESYKIILNDGSEVKIKSANELNESVSIECVRSTDIIEENVTWLIKGDAILIKSVNSKTIKKS